MAKSKDKLVKKVLDALAALDAGTQQAIDAAIALGIAKSASELVIREVNEKELSWLKRYWINRSQR